jgi:hypothetical protein
MSNGLGIRCANAFIKIPEGRTLIRVGSQAHSPGVKRSIAFSYTEFRGGVCGI